MSLADELAKLQQLKVDGVLSPDEFARAKQKLLADDEPATPPPPTQTVHNALIDEFEDIADAPSTLGRAANRYIDYKYKSQIIGVVLFIIMAIIMFTLFNNASSHFGGSSWQIGR